YITFFFQAEDGIRDRNVTGVQTCALPIYEDDAGRVFLALLEQVAHARGADAHEHLDKVRARDGEKRHVRLAGDRLGQQRLAGSEIGRASCRGRVEVSGVDGEL